MAYDECWGTATARANSPLPVLTDSVNQYKALGVPPEKLVMGLPWYGWDFPCDGVGAYTQCNITVPKGKEWYGYATQISYSTANNTATHGYRIDQASNTAVTEYLENTNGTEVRHQQ